MDGELIVSGDLEINHLKSVENSNLEIRTKNLAPIRTGIKANLIEGLEDAAYTIRASDLIQGYEDPNNFDLSVTNLASSVGSLKANENDTWTLIAPENFNGSINLSYSIINSIGIFSESIETQSISLAPVNDAPVSTGDVDFGSIDEDSSFTISATDVIEKLLSTTTDVDGDTLTIDNLKLVEGEGTLNQNIDGSYTFTPAENYNGLISGSYTINDGNGGSIDANATLTVNPVNDAPGDIDEDSSFTISATDVIEKQ